MQLVGYNLGPLVKNPARSLRGWWAGRLSTLGFVAAVVASIVGTGMSVRSEQLVGISVALGGAATGESIYGLMNWAAPERRVRARQFRAFARTVAAVAASIFAGAALKGLNATDPVRILATVAFAMALLQVVAGEKLAIANEDLENSPSSQAAERARRDAFLGVIAQAFLTALFVSMAACVLIVEALGLFALVFLVPALVLVVGASMHAAEVDNLPQ